MRPRFMFATLVLAIYSLDSISQVTKSDSARIQETPSEGTKPFRLSGEAGIFGELYSMSGRDARRPSSIGRLFLRQDLSVLNGLFTIGLNMMLSTEDSRLRQSFNNFGINPAWSWGRAYVLDFNPTFSQYVLNGISVRGGGLELFPGIFHFFAVGGKTQRSVESGFNAAFDRMLYGAKIGVMTKSGLSVDLMFIRSKDDAGSAPSIIVDTIRIDTFQQEVRTTVQPQENLVAGISSRIPLFENALVVKGDFAGTVYSRDVNSSEVETGRSVPSFFQSLFGARLSSAYDYSWNLETDLNLSLFSLRGGFRYVGPGYLSSGLASLINDQRGWFAGFGTRLFDGVVTLRTDFSSQEDNLIGQKLFTTTRNVGTATIGVRPIMPLFLNVGVTLNSARNDASKDTLKVDYLVTVYNLVTMYQFSAFDQPSSLNLSYAYQVAADENELRRASNFSAHTVNAMCGLGVSRVLTISPSLGFTTSTFSDTVTSTILTTGIGVLYRAFDGKLPISLTTTYSNASNCSSVGTMLSATYNLSPKDIITFQGRMTFLNGTAQNVSNYSETVANMGYTRRF